jgi:hypothetical protein
MGLIKYGLAVGIGYQLGQPNGRQQLLRLRQKIVELAREPAIRQLRERGWDIACGHALAAKNLACRKLSGKSEVADADATTPAYDTDRADPQGRNRGPLRGRKRGQPRPYPVTPPTAGPSMGNADQAAADTGSTADNPTPTGFGGRTVAEDSEAAISGMYPPPPAGRVPPTVPPIDRP